MKDEAHNPRPDEKNRPLNQGEKTTPETITVNYFFLRHELFFLPIVGEFFKYA